MIVAFFCHLAVNKTLSTKQWQKFNPCNGFVKPLQGSIHLFALKRTQRNFKSVAKQRF